MGKASNQRRRLYEKPKVVSSEVFEKKALGCGKISTPPAALACCNGTS